MDPRPFSARQAHFPRSTVGLEQLPVVIQIELMNPTNTIGFSVASIWEIVIKSALDCEDLSSTQ